MNRYSPMRLPPIEQAIGGSIPNWLRHHDALGALVSHGYVELPLNSKYLRAHAPRIYEGLAYIIDQPKVFCIDPRHFPYDEVGERIESGLMYRTDDERKWTFHVAPELEKTLNAQGAPLYDLTEFFQSAYELNRAAWLIACVLAMQFDAQFYPGRSMAARFQNGYHLSRFLDYPRLGNVDALAKSHTDRSGFTVHWLSTHPGLHLWDRWGRCTCVDETNPGMVLVFLGRKFATLTQGLFGYGTPHAVADCGRALCAEHRRAIVSFVHPALTKGEADWHLERKEKGYFHALPLLTPA